MARHSLFPNSITINYTSNGHTHKQQLPVGAVTPSGSSWTLPTRSGGSVDWKTAVDALVVLTKPFFPAAASLDSADLFDYEATDAPASFLDSHAIGVAGTDAGTVKPWIQTVMPFKAIGGTILRFTLVETVIEADVKHTYAGSAAPFCALMDFILGSSDWIITRGGTFPSVSLGYVTKINDKLRKRYFAP